MKNRRFSDVPIMGILRQAESGVPVTELCREHGMSNASFYKWRAKYGGMDASMMSEMKAMAEENRSRTPISSATTERFAANGWVRTSLKR